MLYHEINLHWTIILAIIKNGMLNTRCQMSTDIIFCEHALTFFHIVRKNQGGRVNFCHCSEQAYIQ